MFKPWSAIMRNLPAVVVVTGFLLILSPPILHAEDEPEGQGDERILVEMPEAARRNMSLDMRPGS